MFDIYPSNSEFDRENFRPIFSEPWHNYEHDFSLWSKFKTNANLFGRAVQTTREQLTHIMTTQRVWVQAKLRCKAEYRHWPLGAVLGGQCHRETLLGGHYCRGTVAMFADEQWVTTTGTHRTHHRRQHTGQELLVEIRIIGIKFITFQK